MEKAESVVHLREDAIVEVASIIKRLSAPKIFFVVDRDAYAACGAGSTLDHALRSSAVSIFSDFELNPKFHDVERGIELFRKLGPNLVIALGGGTAIDLAKLIGSLAVHRSQSALEIVKGTTPISRCGPTLIAIPTTAGTGCEATQFAVAYVDDEKFSVAHPTLLPDYAIVDSRLTQSLPPSITAATGLDAFCQAIESIWAVGATTDSIGFAIEAARLAYHNLPQATRAPTPDSRLKMCQAAHLAGKAINISKTTASHAISYPLTSIHGVPHGIAVALTLSRVMSYNAGVTDSDCVDSRGAKHVHHRISLIVELLGAVDVSGACERIQRLVCDVGVPDLLAKVELNETSALQRIVDGVNSERLSNNPRRINQETLLRLLTESVSQIKDSNELRHHERHLSLGQVKKHDLRFL